MTYKVVTSSILQSTPRMQPDYERNYLLMTAHDKVAFRFLVSVSNINAFDDATTTASESFLTWDILEDAMPFLTQPTINVDIRWAHIDLKEKVLELGLQKQQIVILINSSQIKGIPQDSAVLGYPLWNPSGISWLLDPKCIFMDATMSNVQEVGDGFLSGCSSLKEVDLSPLSNVQKVGHRFLGGCSSLTEVDLSHLSDVQEVGDCFLEGCYRLEEVKLNPFSNVQKVGKCFLGGCSSQEEVNLSPFSKVQKVGDCFLGGCSSLKEVNLSPLSKVQKVGYGFLEGCSSLSRVIISASPPECLHNTVRFLPYVLDTPHSSIQHTSKTRVDSPLGKCWIQ